MGLLFVYLAECGITATDSFNVLRNDVMVRTYLPYILFWITGILFFRFTEDVHLLAQVIIMLCVGWLLIGAVGWFWLHMYPDHPLNKRLYRPLALLMVVSPIVMYVATPSLTFVPHGSFLVKDNVMLDSAPIPGIRRTTELTGIDVHRYGASVYASIDALPLNPNEAKVHGTVRFSLVRHPGEWLNYSELRTRLAENTETVEGYLSHIVLSECTEEAKGVLLGQGRQDVRIHAFKKNMERCIQGKLESTGITYVDMTTSFE
jgi:hypothetical protein